jgi:hypothetical protein
MTLKEDILDYKTNGWKPLPKKYFNLNRELNKYTIDLHGLTKKSSKIEILKRLEILKEGEILNVIVGRGLNSTNGSVLGPFLVEYFKSSSV